MSNHKLPPVPEFPKHEPEPVKACHYVVVEGQEKPPEATITATPDGGLTVDFEPARGTAGTNPWLYNLAHGHGEGVTCPPDCRGREDLNRTGTAARTALREDAVTNNPGHVKYGVPKEDLPDPVTQVVPTEELLKLRSREQSEVDSLVIEALKSIPGLSPFDVIVRSGMSYDGEFLIGYKTWLELKPVEELLEVTKHREAVTAAIDKAIQASKDVLDHGEAECAALEREAKGWEDCAAQFLRDAKYYRGVVEQIGAMLGPVAYIADDGNKHDEVLIAKVPELVKQLIERLDGYMVETQHKCNEVDDLRREKAMRGGDIKHLQDEIVRLNENVTALFGQINDRDEEIEPLKGMCESYGAEVRSLRAALEQKDAVILRLRDCLLCTAATTTELSADINAVLRDTK